MTEKLKTLKDIGLELCREYECNCFEKDIKDIIRKEVIKWIKELRKLTRDIYIQGKIDMLEHFFNIPLRKNPYISKQYVNRLKKLDKNSKESLVPSAKTKEK